MRLAALSAAQRPARGQAPSAQPRLLGNVARKPARQPGIRERLFEQWLATAQPGASFVYCRGSLATETLVDPDLAALAERLRALSTGYFVEVSPCGHERGLTIGSGQLELATRREQGETIYMATKR